MEIKGLEKRIPDGIIYINGLPMVVLEFKSAVKEETTIKDTYTQLTVTNDDNDIIITSQFVNFKDRIS